MIKYELRRVTDNWTEAEKLASEGWELVSVTISVNTITRCYFKRVIVVKSHHVKTKAKTKKED